jgi:hypothetical protein
LSAHGVVCRQQRRHLNKETTTVFGARPLIKSLNDPYYLHHLLYEATIVATLPVGDREDYLLRIWDSIDELPEEEKEEAWSSVSHVYIENRENDCDTPDDEAVVTDIRQVADWPEEQEQEDEEEDEDILA